MSEDELAPLQRQVQRERKARKEAERLLEEKSLALYRSNQLLQQDIIERKRTETLLRESEEKFRVIFDGALDGIALADAETKQLSTGNPAFLHMLGYSLEELSHAGVADIHPQQDLPHVIEQFESQLRGEIQIAADIPVKRKDGSVFYADIKSAAVNFGGKTFLVGIFRDITERKQLEDELKRQAHIDVLTGLNNRRHFFELAEQELARAKRHGTPLTALMLDLDRFKLVNDTHGHQVGDMVLKKLSEVCVTTLREIDILGRIGGEEFAILLPQTTSEQALEVAERLRLAVAAAAVPLAQGDSVHFTISLGVASLAATDATVEDLLKRADTAMYTAKNTGRYRVCCEAPVETTALNKTS